jgi:hypothetical protein
MVFIFLRADKMSPINIFALVELAFVLIVLFGKSLCGVLLPYNYRKKFGYQLLSKAAKEPTTPSPSANQGSLFVPPILSESGQGVASRRLDATPRYGAV